MPRKILYKKRYFVPSFKQIAKPLTPILPNTPRLDSRGNRPLQMNFEDQLNTFYNPVFGTPYFSYARDVMPFNLIHIQPNIGYHLNDTLLVTLSNDVLWRASTSDAFYTGTNKIGIDVKESNAYFICTQAQLAVNWKINRNIVTRMHAVYFWAGDVVEDGGGEDQTYFHLGINFLF